MRHLSVIPVLLTLACGSNVRDVSGLYAEGSEFSAFVSCSDHRDLYWIADSSLSSAYQRIARKPLDPVFVRLTGIRSDSGAFGHMGSAKYSFTVKTIVEIRARGPGECAPLPDSPAAPVLPT